MFYNIIFNLVIFNSFAVTDNRQRVLTPQLNHISMKMPSTPLLLERDSTDTSNFCNKTSLSSSNCVDSYCECTHVLNVSMVRYAVHHN